MAQPTASLPPPPSTAMSTTSIPGLLPYDPRAWAYQAALTTDWSAASSCEHTMIVLSPTATALQQDANCYPDGMRAGGLYGLFSPATGCPSGFTTVTTLRFYNVYAPADPTQTVAVCCSEGYTVSGSTYIQCSRTTSSLVAIYSSYDSSKQTYSVSTVTASSVTITAYPISAVIQAGLSKPPGSGSGGNGSPKESGSSGTNSQDSSISGLGGLSGGAKAAIGLGVVLGIVLVGVVAAVILLHRRRKRAPARPVIGGGMASIPKTEKRTHELDGKGLPAELEARGMQGQMAGMPSDNTWTVTQPSEVPSAHVAEWQGPTPANMPLPYSSSPSGETALDSAALASVSNAQSDSASTGRESWRRSGQDELIEGLRAQQRHLESRRRLLQEIAEVEDQHGHLQRQIDALSGGSPGLGGPNQ